MTETVGNLLIRAERSLLENTPLGPGVEAGLRAAMEDTLSPGGKRLRMLLVLELGNALGLSEHRAELLASAMEQFHAASLILDDMPCMDNAVLRHGRSCVHVAHGESRTILAALSLISRSYLLAELALAHLPEAARVHAHLLMERCLGAEGLSGGQAADLSYASAGYSVTGQVRRISRVALLKTGGLFRLSLLLPALASCAPVESLVRLTRISVYWSLAYQLRDDLRDVSGESAVEGKTTGRDAVLGRPNLALAAGRGFALKRLRRLALLAEREIQILCAQSPKWQCLNVFHRALIPSSSVVAEAA